MNDERPHAGDFVEAVSPDGNMRVTSTTMSQKQANEAVGAVEENKQELEQETRQDAEEQLDKSDSAAAEARREEIEKRRPGRFRQRIDKRDAKIAERDSTLAERDAKISELEARLAASPERVDQGNANEQPQQTKRGSYEAAVREFEKVAPDFAEALGKAGVQIPQWMHDTIEELGAPEVAYEIAKRPEVVEQFAELVEKKGVEEAKRQIREAHQVFEAHRSPDGQDIQRKHADFIQKVKGSDFERTMRAAISRKESMEIPAAAIVAMLNQDNAHDVANHLANNGHLRNELLEMYRHNNIEGIFSRVQKTAHWLEMGGGHRSSTSAAPPPIRPVNGSTRVEVDLEKLADTNWRAFRSEREQSEKNRYARRGN